MDDEYEIEPNLVEAEETGYEDIESDEPEFSENEDW